MPLSASSLVGRAVEVSKVKFSSNPAPFTHGCNTKGRRVVLLKHSLFVSSLCLGLQDLDDVGECVGGSLLSFGVGGEHDADLDTDNTLLEEDVADADINEILGGLTSLDHVAITELHLLGTLAAELAGDLNFDTLGLRLHNDTQNTVAGTTNSNTVQQLETQGLSLGQSRETTEGNALSVQLDGAIREVETLLDDGSQLANAAALLTQNILGTGGTDDDLSALGGLTDLDTSETIVAQLALEEVVQLGVEETILDELYSVCNQFMHAITRASRNASKSTKQRLQLFVQDQPQNQSKDNISREFTMLDI